MKERGEEKEERKDRRVKEGRKRRRKEKGRKEAGGEEGSRKRKCFMKLYAK